MTVKFVPIIPGPLNVDKMLDTLRDMVKKQAKFSNTQFGLTYRTHKHKPSFKEEFKETPKEMTGSALTSGEGSKDNPYPFLKGTKPHIIKPKRAKSLVFRSDYTAKTSPRIIGSRSGGSSGALVFSQGVRHPGTKDRKFEEEIAKREQPKFEKRGQAAMDKAAKQSGHKI